EIERVSWYRPDGITLMSLDKSGILPAGDHAPLDESVVADLAAKVGVSPPYLMAEDVKAGRRFRLTGPIWTESLTGDGLFEFAGAGAETTVELLGFVSMELDYSAYQHAFLSRLALAGVVLALLLAASWW